MESTLWSPLTDDHSRSHILHLPFVLLVHTQKKKKIISTSSADGGRVNLLGCFGKTNVMALLLHCRRAKNRLKERKTIKKRIRKIVCDSV